MPAKRSRPRSIERPGKPTDHTPTFTSLPYRLSADATKARRASQMNTATHTAATNDAPTAMASAGRTARAAKAGETAKAGKAAGQAGKTRAPKHANGSGGADGSLSDGGIPSLTGAEIRERFLSYFEQRDHLRMASASLVSRDPTVLFTVAGMQQMIPFFLGQEQPPRKRLTTAQKVYRTIDIEEVGDSSHLTFFEMLGNFSVGDYFKREAIAFAWELLTQGYGIPATRLFPTVHPDDAEAPRLWQEIAGIPDAEITRLSDNWWGPPGDRGPCGPDSEIYFDRGAAYGCGRPDCAPGCEHCDRYLEIWNLVFMQYYQDADGNRTLLKQPNIDTGMGLERLASVLQGKESVYDTDLFRTIIDAVAHICGITYGENPAHDRALRVIADHGRGLTFLAGDGILPSTTGRGYVFRRVLRRAALFGRRLGLDRPFLGDVADVVIGLMGSHYTELVERRDQIVEVLTSEERRFNKTLTVGLQVLTRELDELARTEQREVPGRLAFRLHDTHGFPLELTEEIARERGMTVDRAGFESAMLEQKERARQEKAFVREREEEAWTQLIKGLPATRFTGFEGVNGESQVVALMVNGAPVDEVSAPDMATVVLAETPFYAEMGGQIGDRGVIGGPTGLFEVTDTQRPVPGLIAHYGQMIEGHLRIDSEVRAQVDQRRRRAIMRNHSATHLLHRALKDILGEQVNQKGSLVAPDYLRFDFNLSRPLTTEELRELDRRVSDWILEDLPVTTEIMPYKEAIATGAMALFGEKYGDEVRVVTMGSSKELCGGTHVAATGQIGIYLTTQEASVGANLRRIVALTGTGADTYLRSRNETVSALTARLQTTPDDLLTRIQTFQEELAQARKQLAQAQRQQARVEAERIAASATSVRGVKVATGAVSVRDDQTLREMGDMARALISSGVIALVNQGGQGGQTRFIVTVDEALTTRGLDAGKIASALGARLGGKGGGRPTSAQGGAPATTDTAALQAAFGAVREYVEEHAG